MENTTEARRAEQTLTADSTAKARITAQTQTADSTDARIMEQSRQRTAMRR